MSEIATAHLVTPSCRNQRVLGVASPSQRRRAAEVAAADGLVGKINTAAVFDEEALRRSMRDLRSVR